MKLLKSVKLFAFTMLILFCQQVLAHTPSAYEQLLAKGSDLRQEAISEDEFISSLNDLPAAQTTEGRIYLEVLAHKQSEKFRSQLQQWLDLESDKSSTSAFTDVGVENSQTATERLTDLQEIGPAIKSRHYWITGCALAIAGLAYWGRNKEISFQWKGF